jgi:hypothetical protein
VRKGDESIVEQALDWKTEGARRRRRPKQTWKKTVLEEAGKCGTTWSEVRRLASWEVGRLAVWRFGRVGRLGGWRVGRVGWRCFKIHYVPNGA